MSHLHSTRMVRPRGFLQKLWPSLKKSALALGAGIVLCIFALVAVSGPLLTPYPATEMHFDDRLLAPNARYLLGTDEFGRDILSRIMAGSRVTLAIALASILFSLAFGAPLGAIAGFLGGRVDDLISRALDATSAFPAIILAMVLVAWFGPNPQNLVLVIGIVLAPRMARVVRTAVLAQMQRDYVLASRAVGVPQTRILVRHILPNCLSPIIVAASLDMAVAIKVEAALSFLGLGTQLPNVSWGSLLTYGYRYLTQAPWYALFPGLSIFLVIMALNLLGDGLRDALEPRLR